MAKYYTPSGGYSPISFLYFLIAALIAIPILATIYTYAIWYIPLVYINFFITAGFGYGIGIVISFLVVKYGKIRNGTVATIFGFLGALIALYIHWAIWVDLVLNISDTMGSDRIGIAVSNAHFDQVFGLLTSPGSLMALIGEINEFGTWGIRGGTVSGTFLTVIWIIEALIIIVLSLIIPSGQSSKPFCELNQKWFEEKLLSPMSFISDVPKLIAALESGGDTSFDDLTIIHDSESKSHSLFSLYANDSNENYLTIENKLASVNDKGETEFEDDVIANYISISENLSKKLESMSA